MTQKSAIKIDKNIIQIDQHTMFQRLALRAQKTCPDDKEIFEYELCSFPPALFDSNGFPLEANKASLADHLCKNYASVTEICKIPNKALFVLDGGSQLHLMPWSSGVSSADIVQIYVDYVFKKLSGYYCL